MSKLAGKKVGLALGSGAARGMAHIGVLDALVENNIAIHCVAGTSAGALVGGAFSAGRLNDLRDAALSMDWRETARYFIDMRLHRSGLVDGRKVSELVEQIVGQSNLSDMQVPFCAVAAEVLSGKEVVIDSGTLVDAIRASISVPGIFTPIPQGDGYLVDGGMVNPVPVSVCRAMGAEVVIAVDVNLGRVRDVRDEGLFDKRNVSSKEGRSDTAAKLRSWLDHALERVDAPITDVVASWMNKGDVPNLFDVLGNSIRIMESQISENKLQIDKPDLLLRPRVGHISFLEFYRAAEAIHEGYTATMEGLGTLS